MSRTYIQPNFLPVNECGVTTIYPMNVTCIPIPPLAPSNKGSLILQIVGGTPPYTISLLNFTGNVILSNSNLANIPNLLPGTYFVEITDNFGDFQQVINCTIEAPPPTPTPTPLPLPSTPSYQEYSFCVSFNIKRSIGTIVNKFQENFIFILYSFTTVNNITTPMFVSNTGEEFVYWDYTINRWNMSATTTSTLNVYLTSQTLTNWDIINTTPLPVSPASFTAANLPTGSWSLIQSVSPPITGNISTVLNCKPPTLFLYVNESWWQYYSANIPSDYRNVSCGGQNKTPYFRWTLLNPGGININYFDLLCVNSGTGDVYWNITNINPNQFEVSDTIPWQSPAVTGATLNNSLRNNRGWQGPCVASSTPINFTVTLTANLVSGGPLTSTINFIYCQNILNGICGI